MSRHLKQNQEWYIIVPANKERRLVSRFIIEEATPFIVKGRFDDQYKTFTYAKRDVEFLERIKPMKAAWK